MKLSEIVKELDLEVLINANLDECINDAYVSDLLSDVMGNAKAGQVWITMQTHKNVAAIASLKDLPAVIIVNGGKPEEDMLLHARSEGVAILISKLPTYKLSALLYNIINCEV